MSSEMKKKLGWVAVVGAALSLGISTFIVGFRSPAKTVKEFRLVAKEMAFYLEGNPQPNPTLTVYDQERIRLRLINRDKGMDHDLVILKLGLSTGKVSYGEETVLDFQPKKQESLDYLCSFHATMMRGKMVVLKITKTGTETIAQQ